MSCTVKQVHKPEASKGLQSPLPVRNYLNVHLDGELPLQIAPTALNYSHLGDSHLLRQIYLTPGWNEKKTALLPLENTEIS